MSWRVSTRFGEATSSTVTRSSERSSNSSSLAPLPRVAHASAMETLTLPGNFAIASLGRPLKRTKGSVAFSNSARSSSRSEEHTTELQSRGHHVCRILHEKIYQQQKT